MCEVESPIPKVTGRAKLLAVLESKLQKLLRVELAAL